MRCASRIAAMSWSMAKSRWPRAAASFWQSRKSALLIWKAGGASLAWRRFPALGFDHWNGGVRPQERDERLGGLRLLGGGADRRRQANIALDFWRERADQLDPAIGQNSGNNVDHQF